MLLKNKTKKLHMKTLYLSVMFITALLITGIMTGILAKADGKGQIYALRVSTGVNPGADIGSFVITYKSNNEIRRAYINPHDGDYNNSLKMANSSNADSMTNKKKLIDEIFKYDVKVSSGTSAGDALTQNSLNTYFFTTDYNVDEFISIGVMTSGNNSAGKKWSCFDMSLYKVEKIEGFVESGFLSAGSEIGFRGTLIETMGFNKSDKNPAYEFSFGKNGMVTLQHEKGESSKVWLEKKNEAFDNTTTSNNTYTIKVDIADVYKAGFEAYVKDSKDNAKLSKTNPAELLVLRIDYLSDSGALKTVNIPVIASSICYAVEKGVINKDSSLADILPQGGSLAFTANLPGFKSVYNAFIYYIGKEDKKDDDTNGFSLESLTGLVTPLTFGESIEDVNRHIEVKRQHLKLYEDGANDIISLAGVQIYEGANAVNISYENGTIIKATPNSGAKLLSYAVAPERTGFALKMGGVQKINFVSANGKDAITKPADKRALYLVEVKTSTLLDAGTTSDIVAKIKYLDNNDAEKEVEFRFTEEALPFYGYWPDASGAEAGYKLIMQNGAKYHAIIAIDSVSQFSGIKLDNMGDDAWLTEGVSIYKIENNFEIGGIYYKWNDKAGQASVIHGREVHGHLLDFERSLKEELEKDEEITYVTGIGYTGDKGTPEKPTDPVNPENPEDPENPDNPNRPHSDEKAQGIYVQGNTGKDISFNSEIVNEIKDNRTNIFDYLYDMPFEVATTDFGFDSKRIAYKVDVYVGSDPYGSIQNGTRYDDCGSKNLFYFQLIFENGKSAYVQANQQMQSDSFRSGETEKFIIYVNQEYGTLKSVNVIPEANTGNGNPYDKLNIDKIVVTRTAGSGFSQTYETSDKLGWIGVDYTDNGDNSSYHSTAQLERKFSIAKEHNTANIQFALTCDSLPANVEQFKGTVGAEITYKKTDGTIEKEFVDVARAIHEFNGTLGVAEESSLTSSDGTKKLLLSNPGLMFRPNHTDRFIWSFPDIKSIEKIDFKFTNTTEKRTGVNLSCVEVSLIKKGDISKNRSINIHGEYILDGTVNSIIYTMVNKDVELDAGFSETVPVIFDNDEASSITKVDERNEPYVIKKESLSGNDTVNIYAYVSAGQSDLSGFDVSCDVNYIDIVSQDRHSPNPLRLTTITDENGAKHQVYCCENLSVKNMASIKNIGLKASGDGTDIAIDYIIVQHIRNNVVMGNYRADFVVPGVSIKNLQVFADRISKFDNNQGYQEITIQLGDDIYDNESEKAAGKEKILVSENYDMAISLAYKFATGNTDAEYNTENIYLTSTGINSIKPGQVIKFRVYNANIGEITGLSISTTSYLKADIKGATVGTYAPTNKSDNNSVVYECTGWYSFGCGRVVQNETARFNVIDTSFDGPNTWSTLTMNIKTLKSYIAEGGSIGTDVGLTKGQKLMMSIYFEDNGELQSYVIDDITRSLVSGDFSAGNTAEFSFMVRNMRPDNVKKVEFKPYDSDENTNIVWGVDTIDLSFGEGVTSKTTFHVEPRRVMSEKGDNEPVSFAKVMISGTVEKVEAEFDSEDENVITSAKKLEEISKLTQISNKKIYIDNYSPKHVYRVYINVENSSLGYEIDENKSRGFKFYKTDEENVIYFSIDAKEKEERVLKIVSEENKDNFLEITFAIESKVDFEMNATVDEVDAEFSATDGTLVESDTLIQNLATISNKAESQINITNYSASNIYKIKYDIDDKDNKTSGVEVKADAGITMFNPVKEDDENILYCSIDGNVGDLKKIKIISKDNEECYLDVVFVIKSKAKYDISAAVQEVSVSFDGNNVGLAGIVNNMGTVTQTSGTRFAIDEHTPDKVYRLFVNIDKSSMGYTVEADREFVSYQSTDGCLYYSIDGKAGEVKKIRIISEENKECYLDIIFDIKAVQVAPSKEVESVEESKEVEEQ